MRAISTLRSSLIAYRPSNFFMTSIKMVIKIFIVKCWTFKIKRRYVGAQVCAFVDQMVHNNQAGGTRYVLMSGFMELKGKMHKPLPSRKVLNQPIPQLFNADASGSGKVRG